MREPPSSAEEVVDLRTTTEQFQGREWELVTGRVVLHALGADGQAPDGRAPDRRALCGLSAGHLAPIEQRWEAGYLPHVPRCRACAAAWLTGDPPAVLAPGPGGQDPFGPEMPATGVDVRTVHGTETELAGAAALRDVLAQHDLRRWMFTDLARVDEQIRGGFSHPLTISPALLLRRPATALTTFLHEQLHWTQGPGIDNATTEARARWPDPPPPPAGGHDAESTWLHLTVCALEYQSLSELLGPSAAAGELRQHQHYAWIYGQILDDPGWFSGFLHRHGLGVPEEPPVPRRYFGEEWWTNLV